MSPASKKSVFFLLTLLFWLHAYSQKQETGVQRFEYEGFSDTSVALLRIDCNLKNVGVSIFDEAGRQVLDTTIRSGTYLGFSHGYHNLIFYKAGYDTVVIEKYYAVPDQVSSTVLYINKGNKKVNYTTHPPKYLFPKNQTDTTYFENGQISIIDVYKNNSLIRREMYFPDGRLKYRLEEIENKLTKSYEYFENGQLKFIAFWNSGTTEGYRKEYFENGQLKEHLLNTDQGQLTWYSADSVGNCMVRNGNTILEYRTARNLDATINLYKGGMKDGKWITRYDNGNPLWIEEFSDGKRILYEFYDNDGKLVRRTTY